MKKTFLLLTFSCFSISLFAQNYIYDLNQSGFSLEAMALFPEDSKVFGINPSYTWNGNLTAGLGISSEKADDADAKAISFSPNLSYLFYKKELNNNILNIGLNTSYELGSFSGNDIDNDLKSYLFNIGLGTSMKFNYKDDFNFTLGGNVSWGNLKVKLNSFDESEDLTHYNFYGNFMYNEFYVQPKISFINIADETNSTFSIAIGYIFASKKVEEE